MMTPQVHWPHWPHWASELVDDVEREGEFQIIGLLVVAMMLVGAFLLAVFGLIFDLVHQAH